MSYVVDKSGDFSDYHEVHKGTCPNRPKVDDSYLIDGDFSTQTAYQLVKEQSGRLEFDAVLTSPFINSSYPS